MTGFINVYKERGYTSHDVAAILRKLTGAKAGHTGTLDPDAEGVLPVCVGRATKLADYVMATDKTYVAEVVLGITTDTADITGTVLTRTPDKLDMISYQVFSDTAMCFVGEIEQLPPMYSAVKIDGKKLYELARKGKTAERKPRRVVIEQIRVLSREEARALGCGCDEEREVCGTARFCIEVTCSKGTYIRALCEDIGAQLGCGAAMGALTRTRSGLFTLDNAAKIGTLRTAAEEKRLYDFVLPPEAILPYPKATVRKAGLNQSMNGNPMPASMAHNWKHILPAAEPAETAPDFEDDPDIKPSLPNRFWLYTPNGHRIGLFAPTPSGKNIRAEVLL